MAQIIKRGADSWQVRVYLGKDNSGKKLFHTKTIRGLKRDAIAYADSYKYKAQNGFVTTKSIRLIELWDAFIKAKTKTLSPNTIANYIDRWENVWKPLGAMYITDITPLCLQRYIDSLGSENPWGMKQAIAIFKAMFNQAIKWGVLANNPCSGIISPKTPPTRREVLSLDDIIAFLECAKRSKYGLFFRLAIVSGARTGELLGLCWDCVNFDDDTIVIKRDMICHQNVIKDGVKNKSSYRTIKIDSVTMTALHNAYLSRIGNVVFYGKIDSNKPITKIALTREFHRILQRARINKKLRLYDLRHSSASYLIHIGVPVRAVADRLGHTNPNITLKTYTHALPEQEDRIVDAFQAL